MGVAVRALGIGLLLINSECAVDPCAGPGSCVARAAAGEIAAFTVDRGQLFWIGFAGDVHAAPATGGGEVTLVPPPAERPSCRGAVAASAQSVFFSAGDELFSVPRAGGAALPVAGTQKRDCETPILADDKNLYWVNDHALMAQPLAGGPGVALADAGVQLIQKLSLMDSKLYWPVATVHGTFSADALAANTGIWRVPIDGSAAAERIVADDGQRELALDGRQLYFPLNGRLQTAALDGSGGALLSSFDGDWGDLVGDGRRLYWIDLPSQYGRGSYALSSMQVDGEDARSIVFDRDSPRSLIEDSGAIFFLDLNGSSLIKRIDVH